MKPRQICSYLMFETYSGVTLYLPARTLVEVTADGNFEFCLRWVSVPDLVGRPPTKKEVKAMGTWVEGFSHQVKHYLNLWFCGHKFNHISNVEFLAG